jgi:hypothetical protein
MNEKEFGATPEACQRIADDPDIWMTYFMVTQVWSRKPASYSQLRRDDCSGVCYQQTISSF